MLSALVKESQAKQAKLKALNDSNRKEALAATESVANLMTDSVQESVNEVYAAQNKLEKEVKGLQTNTAHFAKQTYQWLEMIKSFDGSLKVCVRACGVSSRAASASGGGAAVCMDVGAAPQLQCWPRRSWGCARNRDLCGNRGRTAATFRTGPRPWSGT